MIILISIRRLCLASDRHIILRNYYSARFHDCVCVCVSVRNQIAIVPTTLPRTGFPLKEYLSRGCCGLGRRSCSSVVIELLGFDHVRSGEGTEAEQDDADDERHDDEHDKEESIEDPGDGQPLLGQ